MAEKSTLLTRPDQTRPDQTRPDQTRPDQTRPDQTVTYGLKSVKEFLKKHDRFHILRKTKRIITRPKHFCSWEIDRPHFNLFTRTQPDRTPYIIRREASTVGLFSYFITILGGIAYAERKGYIPVVDMKNYLNSYLYDSEIGRVNSWEYFFEQPDSLTLEEALSCRKYIIGKDTARSTWPSTNDTSLFYNENGRLDYWRGICRKYIHFTQPVLEGVERELQKFCGKRVLGVSVRGTDYIAFRPHGHPVQPTIEQAVSKTREVMDTGEYDAVYLATEDKYILSEFRQAFGEKLMLPECDYIDFDASGKRVVTTYFTERKNDKYLRGLEYLVSKLLLTKCKSLITSKTSGTTGVMCLSEGFDYLYVFDLGKY